MWVERSSGLESLFYITETSSNPDHPPILLPSLKKGTPLNEIPFFWLVTCFFCNVPIQIVGSAKSEKSANYSHGFRMLSALTNILSKVKNLSSSLHLCFILKNIIEDGKASCWFCNLAMRIYVKYSGVKCFWCGNMHFMAENHYCMPAQIKGF